ncbi:MAG: SUMF1/EgtB/PvdO family nonheme iron enzyme [Nitrospira sp.]|nr:SUMF1/EgtB/PvdO family nonheme iron enzyme [Nitrospira sp.]HNP30724.1 SUMF1/EgtB/PvdO family nonheme iron enzyme [Nitrospirales bacterium]
MVSIRFLVFFLVGMVVVVSPVWSEVSINTLKKGVVKVTAQFTQGRKVGTGFIVGQSQKNLFVVTASHVVEGEVEPPQSITLTFFTRQEDSLVAQVVKKEGGDSRGLALLKVGGDIPQDVEILEWDSKTRFQGGEEFQLIGFPRISGIPWTVTKGIISGFEGQILKFSGAVEEGNSGGPLLYQGKVIGVAMEVTGQFGSAKPTQIAKFTLDNWLVLPELTGGEEKQGRDDVPMVVIPAGEFLMGKAEGLDGGPDEKPQRSIFLDAFSIDVYEVTVEQYHRFVRATGQQIPKYWDQVNDEVSRARFGTKPVVGVSWFDANAYCKWVGKRLPTEAEWEKAARGEDGRFFPWGNDAPGKKSANFEQDPTELVYAERLTPAGIFEPGRSAYGLFDMAGNVWEWVNDWYSENYYRVGPLKNPPGPPQGIVKVLRGGSWKSKERHLRTENRRDFSPNRREPDLGFRCARNAS